MADVLGLPEVPGLAGPDADHRAASCSCWPPGQQDPPPVRFRDNYNVIFIDPYDRARGMVAEGYVKLLRGWTVRAGGALAGQAPALGSARFFVRNGGGLADAVDGMEYAHPSHKMGLADGGELPDPVALAALFDNNLKYLPSRRLWSST